MDAEEAKRMEEDTGAKVSDAADILDAKDPPSLVERYILTPLYTLGFLLGLILVDRQMISRRPTAHRANSPTGNWFLRRKRQIYQGPWRSHQRRIFAAEVNAAFKMQYWNMFKIILLVLVVVWSFTWIWMHRKMLRW